MASSTYIGYNNLLLAAPIASSGVINAPLLGVPIIGRKASLSGSSYVDFFFQPTGGIQMLGVAGLQLASTGTPGVSFAFSALASGASELGTFTYVPSLTPGYATQAWVLSSALATAQFCRISFSNCAAVGLCWASPVLNPEYGIESGMTRKPMDLSVVTESPLTGAATVALRPSLRTVGIRFNGLSDDEFADFDDMVLAVGQAKQVLFVPGLADGRRNRDIMVGRLVDMADLTHIAPDLMEWPYTIRECL